MRGGEHLVGVVVVGEPFGLRVPLQDLLLAEPAGDDTQVAKRRAAVSDFHRCDRVTSCLDAFDKVTDVVIALLQMDLVGTDS